MRQPLERLVALLRRLGAAGPIAAVAEDLGRRYAEAHRVYHVMAHVEECLRRLDEARDACGSPELVELALWFHDAVLAPGRGDNEERSAALLRASGRRLALPEPLCLAAGRIVRATRTHAPTGNGDADLAIDLDLAILGAPGAEYRSYARGIRAEHRHVPALLFDLGRARFLRRLLAAPWIYATGTFREQLEGAARANLRQEFDDLRRRRLGPGHPS